MRTPPQVAPIARDSAALDRRTRACRRSRPRRPRARRGRRSATPFHWLRPGDGDVVAECLQAHQRQLVLAGLGLLQREHVDLVSLHERLDAVDAGAEGVDVPGGDAHLSTLGRRPPARNLYAGNPLQIGARGGGSSARTCLGNSCQPARPPRRRRASEPPSSEETPTMQRSSTRGDRPRLPPHSSARPWPHRPWPPRTRRSRRSRSSRPPTFKDADNQYIVNGDEPVPNTGQLKAFYDRMVGGAEEATEEGLIVNTVGGADDKWSTTQARNLTYCVSTKFGTRYSRRRQRDGQRRRSVGGAPRRRSTSSTCRRRTPTARPATTRCCSRSSPSSTTQYIARAFFPSTPKRSRNVLVDDSL